MIRKPQQLAEALGTSFRNIALLEEALTHRSAASTNNERLEFLGDAVLGFVIAGQLFAARSAATEGEMSRLRATLVRKGTLAQIAREWNIGEYLYLGSGELKSGGHRRASILADTIEAIIGAVYLDQGVDAATAVIRRFYGDRLVALGEKVAEKDPKTKLQEWLQGRSLPLPAYTKISEEGPMHLREFVVRCEVPTCEVVSDGHGRSLRAAEQAAAQAVLEVLLNE